MCSISISILMIWWKYFRVKKNSSIASTLCCHEEYTHVTIFFRMLVVD